MTVIADLPRLARCDRQGCATRATHRIVLSRPGSFADNHLWRRCDTHMDTLRKVAARLADQLGGHWKVEVIE